MTSKFTAIVLNQNDHCICNANQIMDHLCLPEHDKTGTKWKWQNVRQGGTRPSPRCGASLAVGTGERAYVFGGVYDQEDDDDDEGGLLGTFFNDLYLLDLKKFVWHTGECCSLNFTWAAFFFI